MIFNESFKFYFRDSRSDRQCWYVFLFLQLYLFFVKYSSLSIQYSLKNEMCVTIFYLPHMEVLVSCREKGIFFIAYFHVLVLFMAKNMI
jgi:hypothetical protein